MGSSVEEKTGIQNDAEINVSELGAQDEPYIDPAVEKKLVRKLDRYIMSILGVLYLLSFLDRSNIGNANIAVPSISKSLGLVGNQFGASVSVVYATYVVFEPVWANLLKIISPKILLSASTVAWGTLTIATAWAGNYHGLITIRVLLGVFEAGLFPCLTVFLTQTYRRSEMGTRMSFVFAAAAASGAFGGLIAYGLIQIDAGGLVGWQWMYVVEGVISLAFAPVAYFWIPNRVDEAWFFSAEEKKLATIRYQINLVHYNPDEKFSWHQVRLAVTDWKPYCTGIIQFLADITLYGITTFMPAIIRSMDITTSYKTQLLTVPVYFVAAVSFLIIAHFSDKYMMRAPFMCLAWCFLIIGYIILAVADAAAPRFVGVFIVSMGLYVIPGLNVGWISGNAAGHYKRATSVGMNQLIGNTAGACVGFIFTAQTAPRYLQGIYTALGCSIAGLFVTIGVATVFHLTNKKRDQLVAEGALDQPELGDRNPHFRYIL